MCLSDKTAFGGLVDNTLARGLPPPWTPASDARQDEMTMTMRDNSAAIEKRKRYPRVYSRVTEDELARIESDAAAQGMSVGGYLRWLAIERPQTRIVRRPAADIQMLAQIKGQVGRLGGNIHQLLRLANRGEIPWNEDIAIAAKEVGDFLATARDLLRRSGE